jgi:hypothetical protein
VQFKCPTAVEHLPFAQSSTMCKGMPQTLHAHSSGNSGVMPHLRSVVHYMQQKHPRAQEPPPPGLDGAFITAISPVQQPCCDVVSLASAAATAAHSDQRTRNLPLDTVFESGLCSVKAAVVRGAPSGSIRSGGNVEGLSIHNGPRSSQAIGAEAADTQLVHATAAQFAHKPAPSGALVDTRNGPAGHLVHNSLLLCSHADSVEDAIESMFGDTYLR